jgi:DeoR family fructose operon transcriptional repressor
MSGKVAGIAVEDRLRRLTERLQSAGAVSIPEAAADLGVSEMTIRRDLAELEERGAARRVRGGAVPIGPQTFAERHRTRARAKGLVASKLLDLVPSAGAIAFDASSTVMRLAASIAGARDLTVVTNGPDTFAALQARPGVTAISTGGRLDPATGSLVGPIACRSALQFTVDLFITSAAGIDSSVGATEATLDDAEVKRAFAAGAREVVLAVDASKLEQRGLTVALAWDEIDILVSELDIDDLRLIPYRTLTRVM